MRLRVLRLPHQWAHGRAVVGRSPEQGLNRPWVFGRNGGWGVGVLGGQGKGLGSGRAQQEAGSSGRALGVGLEWGGG